MTHKEKAVAVDDIILDERCQPRAILNDEAVAEYSDIYAEGEVKLPPLDVVDVDGRLMLIDGFHRLAAARQADQSFIRVRILEEADIDRAIWLAAAANQGHGVRTATDNGVQPERKPKKAKPSPFEAFRKNVEHIERDVPKFFEPGTEVHEAARRLVVLVREHEADAVAEVA